MPEENSKVSPALHMLHMIVCVLTMGFIFPGAFMENIEQKNHIDLTRRPK